MDSAETNVESGGNKIANQLMSLRTREDVKQDISTKRHRATSGARTSHPLVELTKARVREFVREPEAVFWVFVFPVLLAFALGIAFRNTPPEKSRVAIDATNPQAAKLQAALQKSADVTVVILAPEDAARELRNGTVALIVGAANDTNAVNTTTAASPIDTVTYRFDPTRPPSRTARLVTDDALQRALGRQDVAATKDVAVTENGARYIDFLIPGLIGMNLMGSGMWGVGFAIVSARARKLLKLYSATPMRRSHYLLSFIFSRLIFLALEMVAILGFARLAFGVEVRGSYLALGFFLLLGASAFAGLGLLVAARPKTIEGVSGSMNFIMLPMWLVSGSLFPSSRFPDFMQPFIKILPLTALNDGLRAVMNGSATFSVSWLNALILIIWASITFVIALRIFRWQ